jgi:xylulokinase
MIFMLEDWVLYRLTGNFVTEPTIQSSTTYYDIENAVWWQEMLDFIGITERQLPALCKSAAKVSEYRGIPVISGALDQIAGMIGVGVTDDSGISEMTGTIMAICAMKDEIPAYQENSIIPCHVHAIEGKYCQILWSSTAGMALKWFREQFAADISFAEIDALCENIPAGCDGMTMLPYFCGSTMPKYNPAARGSFTGLTTEHTRGHFVRAVMESVACMLKSNLDYLGLDVDEIRAMGGGASSPLWCQMKADMTGKKLVTLKNKETACLGSAILAAVGVGYFESVEEAAKMIELDRVYEGQGTDYAECYERYLAYDKLLNN